MLNPIKYPNISQSNDEMLIDSNNDCSWMETILSEMDGLDESHIYDAGIIDIGDDRSLSLEDMDMDSVDIEKLRTFQSKQHQQSVSRTSPSLISAVSQPSTASVTPFIIETKELDPVNWQKKTKKSSGQKISKKGKIMTEAELLERRKQHREVVRRSYHRQKQKFVDLRAQVKALEVQKEMALASRQKREDNQYQLSQVHLQKQLLELEEESKVLKANLVNVQAAISNISSIASMNYDDDDDDDTSCLELVSNLDNNDLSDGMHIFYKSKPNLVIAAGRESDGIGVLYYKPLSFSFASDVMEAAIKNVWQFSLTSEKEGITTGAQVMGWEDKRIVKGTQVQFSLKKKFYGINASKAVMDTWNCLCDTSCVEATYQGLMSKRILQRVAENTVVAIRETVSRESNKVFRCVHLLFRVPTARGFLIVVKSLDPRYWRGFLNHNEDNAVTPNNLLNDDAREKINSTTVVERDCAGRDIRYVDMFGWFQFSQTEDQALGVEYGGQMDYGDMAHVKTLVLETLTVVFKWECHIVGPIFSLPSS